MPPTLPRPALRSRARAAGIHLLLSAAVALLAAALVFALWFPGFYRSVAGGRDLFLLVIGVDIVLGPLLTFAVFDMTKGWKHLRRDLAVIGVVQLTALLYGLHTVYVVRPVALAFEVDRFRIVAAGAVREEELSKALPEYRRLPLTGPWTLGTRTPAAGAEQSEAVLLVLKGVERADRPSFWQPYDKSVPDVLARSRPFGDLVKQYPARAAELRDQLQAIGGNEATSRFLPLVARGEWVMVVDARGAVLGPLRADGFF